MFYFEDETMGDLGPYTWNGNPFDYINSVLGLSYGSPNYDPNAEAEAQALLNGFPNLTPPRPQTAATTPPKPKEKSWFQEFDEWLKKDENKTLLMFGGALAVILLTSRKK